MKEIGADWQDIDSAPKDGSMFLAYNPFMGVYSTSYTIGWKKTDGTIDMEYRGFPCGQSSGMLGRWDCQPTHWMPLPEPPSGQITRFDDDGD